MLQAYKYTFGVLCIFGMLIGLPRCGSTMQEVNIDVNLPPFKLLSEYNLYSGDLKELIPNTGLLPFDLITPLFSDYAKKLRFVWMPEGISATYSEKDVFEFPIGAVLIKNFYFPHDFSDEAKGRRVIETRLLVNRPSGWDALAYIWNDEQTEAKLEIAGGIKQVKWRAANGEIVETPYIIPNKNQCKGCHVGDGKFLPIGPKARNLNMDYNYAGEVINQLKKWSDIGYLTDMPAGDTIPKIAKWDEEDSGTLEERAMAYLEVNCGTCHNRKGPAHTTGLYLTVFEKEPTHLGMCKSPVAAGLGSGGRIYDIVPGKPEESILTFRMESTNPGIMMPELGRKLVHKEGVELIKRWITSIKGTCGEES